MKELYNKNLLENERLHSALINESLSFEQVAANEKVIDNKNETKYTKEVNRVYESKYTKYYDDLLAKQMRLVKEAAQKEQQALLENQLRKKLIRGIKKLLKL